MTVDHSSHCNNKLPTAHDDNTYMSLTSSDDNTQDTNSSVHVQVYIKM